MSHSKGRLTRRAIVTAPLLGAGLAASRLSFAADHGYETLFHFQADDHPWVRPLITHDARDRPRWLNLVSDKRAWCIGLGDAASRTTSFAVRPNSKYSHFIEASDGLAYGNHQLNDAGEVGAVHRWKTPHGQAIETLHRFDRKGPDGVGPSGGLTEGFDGALYGSTRDGGLHDDGTLFRITKSGEFSTIYHFNVFPGDGHEGGYIPSKGVVKGLDGHYYGVTELGGDLDSGTLFRVTPDGVLTYLHYFGDWATGRFPKAPPTLGKDGLFYGMAPGGAHSCAVIYSLSHEGEFKVLYSLKTREGNFPDDELVALPDGSLCGICPGGGDLGHGTVFRFRPSVPDKVQVLHHFANSAVDGGAPRGGLTPGRDGYLYGTTSAGGANAGGTVFRIRA